MEPLNEELLSAWLRLSSAIDNQRLVKGLSFNEALVCNLLARAKAMVPLLVPLFVSAFRRADELGDAMDARCYSGSKVRTKYKKLTFGWRDFVSMFVAIALLAAVILLRSLVTPLL